MSLQLSLALGEALWNCSFPLGGNKWRFFRQEVRWVEWTLVRLPDRTMWVVSNSHMTFKWLLWNAWHSTHMLWLLDVKCKRRVTCLPIGFKFSLEWNSFFTNDEPPHGEGFEGRLSIRNGLESAFGLVGYGVIVARCKVSFGEEDFVKKEMPCKGPERYCVEWAPQCGWRGTHQLYEA